MNQNENAGTWPVRLMVYGAGEAVSGANALAGAIQGQLARLAKVATNRRVAALAQLDSTGGPGLRWVLDPWGRQPVLQTANPNVGDPAVLVEFVDWATRLCPARSNVLVLSGHGAAWEDVLFDKALATRNMDSADARPADFGVKAIRHPRVLSQPREKSRARAILVDGQDRDYLSNDELVEACACISRLLGGPIDVLVLDACLMSSWEVLESLRGCVRTVVASIDELSVDGIDLAGPAYRLSMSAAELSAQSIAATISRDFVPEASFDTCVAVDLMSLNWTGAVGAFRSACAILLPWVREDRANVELVRASLQAATRSMARFTAGGFADAAAVATALGSLPGMPAAASEQFARSSRMLESSVLCKATGHDYRSAMGISLFAPDSQSTFASNEAVYLQLGFGKTTRWGEILGAVYG